MSNASKLQDDHDADRDPVPPYPAEVENTWQAFRVTMRDTAARDVNGLKGEDPASEPANDDDDA
jgi:hypothetical protein